ncbi:MAG: hypothetical protein H0T78_10320 [Longispora sp.]|nr:hypothetical protein [Longispora sp. (in: high G+C Gram-positive bacteria)]
MNAMNRPTAIVSLGDSYISGEGGRWFGNSNSFTGSRDGTDRAYRGGLSYDPRSVYGNSYDNGCNRSDVAEIMSNEIPVDRKFNLACSGAKTAHLLPHSAGGADFKGEAPQITQLAGVARENDIKLIAVSIGGNDLGFSPQFINCITGYIGSSSTNPLHCAGGSQDELHSRLPAAMERVGVVIHEIRRVMAENGKAPASYRIILQSYASVLPRASEARYSQSGSERTRVGGCPSWNEDLTWFRDLGISQIAEALRSVSSSQGIEFLDLQDLLEGREVCSIHTQLADANNPPSPETSEWARFLTLGMLQGQRDESMHPNAYGQQAAGKCLELAYTHGPGNFTCENTPGRGPRDVYVSER